MPVSIRISDAFDGGNAEFVEQCANPNDPNVIDVKLRIKPDVYTELEEINHMQYFCFRAVLNGVQKPQRVRYVLTNASAASYVEAWAGTTVCYSHEYTNVDSYKRNKDTFYTQGELSWEHIHTKNESIYFTYFPPFTYERHLSLISKCYPYAHVETLGQSLEGREIECIKTGTGPFICWIIHRQHPGETMAEHYAEGLLTRLLGLETGGRKDEVTRQALELYTFYIVPCMCPDGAVRGHLRTNSVGANLNREWCTKGEYEAPTLHRSPEVYHVLAKMKETGVDMFLDVHGDEELPFNFTSGAVNTPQWGPRLEALHGAFVAAYSRNSELQQKIGYKEADAETVKRYMNIAANQVSLLFDCLGIVLEMPFKDCLTNPEPTVGWTPAKSRELGKQVLEPLIYVHPYLRAEGDFWTSLHPEDAYVETTDEYELEEPEDEDGFKPLKHTARFYSDVHEIHKKHPNT